MNRIKLPTRPKLFEAFSGIGCQRMAFNRIIEYEMVGISEIDTHALKSYEAIHGKTKNYGDIRDIKELPEIDVFTWGFPCQDLSTAGREKGLHGKQSGVVWAVVDLLVNSKLKPKILIMENVSALLFKKNLEGFNEIKSKLSEVGYTHYVSKLNAKDYGVAQNRERVFMVSVLGDFQYDFPKPIILKKRLRDYLESEVDNKYYLTPQQLTSLTNYKFESISLDRVNKVNGVCRTLTTMQGGHQQPFVLIPDKGGGRIRKLTPKECWRLMGIDDSDFNKVENINSDKQLYKQCGNGIVIDVFASILEEMI